MFGSAARGDYRPGSDIDIALAVDAGRVGDIVAYVKIAERVKSAIKAR
ncbi:MAG: nucleotidyltransferase domain-containing protein, partial [Rhodospirillales bacterium]|nr:nucleotidyltransferase domain-containing protein [Rhodospirillales bacterium]